MVAFRTVTALALFAVVPGELLDIVNKKSLTYHHHHHHSHLRKPAPRRSPRQLDTTNIPGFDKINKIKAVSCLIGGCTKVVSAVAVSI